MQINLKMDVTALALRFARGERRLAFEAVDAVNEGAKAVQKAEREFVATHFMVRKPEFTLREAAIIRPFASAGQGRPFAEVFVGTKPRALLATFETGGRKPHRGRNVAIPVTGSAARPTFASPQTFPPLIRKLKFRRPRKRKKGGGSPVLMGAEDTFLVPNEGVFKRVGPSSVRMLYAFKPDVTIPAKLGWRERARIVGEREMAKALRRGALRSLARGFGL